MANYFILMGDVVGSRMVDPEQLSIQLKNLVTSCNDKLKSMILSPLTITLGDEFQGVVGSLEAIVESIFHFEESIIRNQYDFKIRYVGHFGEIQTPINKEIAYEMMGPGLINTRELLTQKSRNRTRILIDLPNEKMADMLTKLFKVSDSIMKRWKGEDYRLIFDMLHNRNNLEVASIYSKNRTQIWKRRNSLLIEEYNLLKSVILDLVKAI